LKKILVLALGGEGGGTLTEWIVEAGLACQWPIQATSIPGVAQRTGATSYYIECLPEVLSQGAKSPPMCLAPLAGDLDLIISSELLETARAVERGMSDQKRTKLISSTTRTLTIQERTGMADSRFDSQTIENTLRAHAQSVNLFDMTNLANAQGTVVSAVMFGAMVASRVLPFPRELCEQIVAQSGGPRAASSLKGFAAGYQAVEENKGPATKASNKPSSLDEVIALGVKRLVDFQDDAYADQFRSIVAGFQKRDTAPFVATQEAARSLALWMAYEDVIRVADLKSRRSRFEQIRTDYRAKPGEPIVVRDFLKPGVDEIAAILPSALAVRLTAWAKKNNRTTFGNGIALATNSVFGLLAMRFLAKLRFVRRASSRFAHEQLLIARWATALNQALEVDTQLACQIAALPRLIKGYSDTFVRGQGNFVRILETLIEPNLAKAAVLDPKLNRAESHLAIQVKSAAEAALANPESDQLYQLLGLQKPAPKEQPIRFAKPIVRNKT
jgi:indolepyruvate ferredoxin oxidoreductase, beta subunit